ncbi:exodeoxyribonuclease V subunit alpha [Desulfosudis oleivorans]|uniref:Exodeoxyribonuclease V, alpha subunit n=1 Tax=Desulfosudis oleivorans (strain DSM 6200 / JCM 39069 / Hxd3) TaxID=96561 RepID=A8ZX10_DESOH|nr:exodeoxyribonuclease V subunit alpha [Desulfosudis oleivorans]ABW66866.1 exodeoxyribonuclease V, alpha subunit [Desulfosudis oleivorans Hxd3]
MDGYRDIQAAMPMLGELDRRFGELLTALDPGGGKELFLAAALTLWHTRRGHVCFDLNRADAFLTDGLDGVSLPDGRQWADILSRSAVVARPGGDPAPLVLDGEGRLYLHRYWAYQEQLADFIRSRAGIIRKVDAHRLKEGLTRWFPGQGPGNGPDMQRVAAVSALTHDFSVITGGPGTGKTLTAARILALLAEQAENRPLAAVLTAPTGKAAARLGEAMSTLRGAVPGPASENRLEVRACTIHRLLGALPGTTVFRHHRHNPIAADVVVVDEASMADVALMAKMVDALPDHCRLILVGDKDQLASVAAGSVFADICGAAGRNRFSADFLQALEAAGVLTGGMKAFPAGTARLAGNVVHLETVYRFEHRGGMEMVSRLVREGAAGEIVEALATPGHQDVTWTAPDQEEWRERLARTVTAWVKDCLSVSANPEMVLDRLGSFRVLCALREGPAGALALNRSVEHSLQRAGVVASGRLWYAGRPVMVLKNDYSLELFNGDVGITLWDGDRLSVFFKDDRGGVRKFHPGRIPEHETVYAMTVHKGQGSEFEKVVFVMPDRDGPVLTRELVYTALTRARSHIEIIGKKDIIEAAVSRSVSRRSGLVEAINNDQD